MSLSKPGAFESAVFDGLVPFLSADQSVTLEHDNVNEAPPNNKRAFVESLTKFLRKRAGNGFTTVARKDDVLQRMYEGDYWQGGTQWMGPLPEGIPENIRSEIARYFAARGMIKECVDRHFDAIVSEDPRINTSVRRPLKMVNKKNDITQVMERIRESMSPEEQDAVDEYDAALTNWYDTQDILSQFICGLPHLLTRLSTMYRIYIPYHLMASSTELPQCDTLDEAYNLIRVMHVPYEQGRMVKTSSGDIVGGWYTYKEGNVRITEIHYIDIETGETVIERMLSTDTRTWEEVARCNLGGRLLLVELSRKLPLVTPQAMQLNNLLNVDFTVLGRNLTQAGFLERIITNAQLPGKFVDTLDGDGSPTGEKTFIPDPLYTGTGTTNVLVGIEQVDEDGIGTGKRADPKVYYRDPVSVTSFVDTDALIRSAIYTEFKQGHLMLAASSVNGRSREQAINDFSASVRFTARTINRGLSNIFDTAAALAAWMIDDEGYNEKYKTVVTCRLSLKLLTPDEKRVIMEQYDKELLSAESAIMLLGEVADVDAEFALIDSESPRRDAFLQRQIKAGAAFALGDGGTSSNPNGNKGTNTDNKAKNKPKGDNGVRN